MIGGPPSVKTSTTTEGYLYVVVHPRLSGWFKVGKTKNPRRRLATYQTGDPDRAYRFLLLARLENHHIAETTLIERLDQLGYLPRGEWFEVPLCILFREFSKLT